jgi:hypothetical protein
MWGGGNTGAYYLCMHSAMGVWKAQKAMVMEVDDIVFGVEGGNKVVSVSLRKIAKVLRMKAGSKKLVDYDSHAEQPEWMGLREG